MSKTDHGTLLVVGATGSIGRLVVDYANQQGWHVRAVSRKAVHTQFDDAAEVIQADVGADADIESLKPVVDDIDAVVFVQGTIGASPL